MTYKIMNGLRQDNLKGDLLPDLKYLIIQHEIS